MKKTLGLFLIVASIMYLLAVVTGGFLKENYNHIYNAISELDEVGTGRIFIVDLLFKMYNYLIMFYGLGMIIAYRKEVNKKMAFVFIMILLCGLSGIMMDIFPQEARDQVLTIKGVMHFVGAGIAAFSTMLITLVTWINYRKDETFKKYAKYSLITFCIIFVSGLGNVILINNGIGSFFGLVERITIGSYILWLFTTGLLQYKEKLKYIS